MPVKILYIYFVDYTKTCQRNAFLPGLFQSAELEVITFVEIKMSDHDRVRCFIAVK